jgi:hypothetical protein
VTVLQGEPEFDRLKRELEEVKNAPRGLEGTFRSAAEMERHRAAAADAAIEEQLEVQTSFRQHGARLQVLNHRSLCMLRHIAPLLQCAQEKSSGCDTVALFQSSVPS